MRKYNIYNPINIAILLIALTIAPENSLIKSKFWAKTEDVNGALAATYNAFRDAGLESFIWGELRADMVTFNGGAFTDYARIAGSDISASNGVIQWSKYYKAINLANTLMYYDKDVLAKDKTFTQKMKNGVDAEALFIRSLSYFYLVRLWKDVPLVIEPSLSDTTNLYLPKSPENVVLDQVIKDLLIAKDLAYTTEFRGDVSHRGYFNGRANKYSIMALLADVYLWKQQYQKCIDYCDSITNTGLYSLEPTDTWFNLYNPGNSPVESIFEIQYVANIDAQTNPIYDNLIPLSGTANLVLNNNTVKMLLNVDDLRNCTTNTPIWKYKGISLDSPVARPYSQRDAHFIYYRYADIILMKAEAETELNNFSEANSLVRETLDRAGMSYVDVVVKKDLRKAVLDERGREFIIEGKRWFDLLRAAKRNHFENKQIIIDMILSGADIKQQAVLRTKVYDTLSYYLPIPEHEITYNQNLVQNPFYTR